MTETRTLIIGVGNPDRGDDGAGPAVASRLRERLDLGHGVHVIRHGGEATGLVDAMAGWDKVLIIDAARSGSTPGCFRVFDVTTSQLPSDLADMSSHGFGVPQAVELARALGTLPKRCCVYAIEGETFEAGAPLSDAVHNAVEAVTREIMQALEAVHA